MGIKYIENDFLLLFTFDIDLMKKYILCGLSVLMFSPLMISAAEPIPVSSLFSKNEPVAIHETEKLMNFCTNEFKFEPLKYH